MTIDEFVKQYGNRRKTVIKWIGQNYIPGANLEKDYVPDSARQPYTKARAKNAGSIYTSMVKASYNRKHILPALYKMCDDEFNGYVNRLIEAKCIEPRISDGVTYYDATLKVNEIKMSNIKNLVEGASKGIAAGVTSALLNN